MALTIVQAGPAADEAQARVAGALRRLGFVRGDRLGVCVPSSAALLEVIMGSLRAGIVPVVVSDQLVGRERDLIRDDAGARRWIDTADELSSLLVGPVVDIADLPLGRPMHYTSGTTGAPKGVWAGVMSESAATAWWAEERAQWGFAPDDVHLVCSPLHHSAPIRFAVATLLAGGMVLVPGRFDAVDVAALVGEHGVTTTFCTPAHLQRLDEHGSLDALATLRLVAHAGAPCPEPLKRRAIAAIGADRLWEFYGATEGQFTACAASEWLERPGTVGRARAGRRIDVDDDGQVWCHVPDFARWVYWNDPERTAAAWQGDAFTVGDFGRLDDDGYLYLVGRRNDLIISGGVNVYPAEVERVLSNAPGVRGIVVFGRPDDRWGQRVCAAVTGDVEVELVTRFAATNLAPYKRPKEIHVVAEIPRRGLSKVRRSTLAADLGLEPSSGGEPEP
jgi:acyl-CoA synthetase (AMP-forming)/AMP-acid ligase II